MCKVSAHQCCQTRQAACSLLASRVQKSLPLTTSMSIIPSILRTGKIINPDFQLVMISAEHT
jgi:hypothetical protein